jgi:uncharacterized membrane protein
MKKRIMIWSLFAYVLGQLYFHAGLALGYDPPTVMTSLVTAVFFVFAASHATLRLGRRTTLVFLLVSFSTSLFFETVGVKTGVIYGEYHYTDRLPLKVFDSVPLLIPLAWFMMLYASYDVVGVIVGDYRPSVVRQQTGLSSALAWLVASAGLGAMAMAAWDLVMDPQMVAENFWVWQTGGEYFGIPARNFAGWWLTAFAIYLIYGLYELYNPPNVTPQMSGASIHLPALSYVITGASGCVSALQRGEPAVFTAGFFGIGGLAWAAAMRLWQQRASSVFGGAKTEHSNGVE